MILLLRLIWAAAFSLIFLHPAVFAQQRLVSAPEPLPTLDVKRSTLAPTAITPSSPSRRANVLDSQNATALYGATPKEYGEKTVDWFTRNTAIAGLALGLLNLGFGIWKLWRDRRLSIEDDFWFRKIISPATIEPMLKTVVTLLEEAPPDRTNTELVRTYALKVTTEFAKLYSAMQTLGLFDSSLPSEVIEKLSCCEDFLTDFSSKLSQTDGSETPSMHDLRKSVLAELNAALLVIKKRHLKR